MRVPIVTKVNATACVLCSGLAWLIFTVFPKNQHGRTTFSLLAALPLLTWALGSLVAAICGFLRRFPGVLGKNPVTGDVPMWSYLVFAPLHGYTRWYLGTEPFNAWSRSCTEVAPGLWVGGWLWTTLQPSLRETSALASKSKVKTPVFEGNFRVVDMTCELPQKMGADRGRFLSLLTWDGAAPSEDQLRDAVSFVLQARREEEGQKKGRVPILIHCANGRGRSVTVMCCVLVVLGICQDFDAAVEHVAARRDGIRVNTYMRKFGRDFLAKYAKES
jgi:protein-tyrosine phosphatase